MATEAVEQPVPSADTARILVTDDERSMRELLAIVLRREGYEVLVAHDGATAIAALERGSVDLLISDIGMADTDGYNLIKQVRLEEGDKAEHIPAIALTAYARAQDRIRAIAAGYNTHVAKPVEIRELVTVVKCLTGRIA